MKTTYTPAKVSAVDWIVNELAPVCGMTADEASAYAVTAYGIDAGIVCDQTGQLLATYPDAREAMMTVWGPIL